MSPVPLTSACVEELERLALEVTGVRFASSALDRAQVAFARIMHERGVEGSAEMLDALVDTHHRVPLIESIVGEATTKETYLFRDPAQFEALRDKILPQAARAARQHGGVVRIWSAGCATGEEAYSVAMLLAETPDIESTVLATDLSHAAIRLARSRVHSGMRLAPDATRFQPLVDRWTSLTPEGLAFAEAVRSRIRFTTHNLVRDRAVTGQHVVLCRNVMIYLPPAAQHDLLDILWDSLVPGGRLLLGDAELLHVHKHRFERLPIQDAVIYGKPLDPGRRA